MNFPLTFNPARALDLALLSQRAYSEMTYACDLTDTQVLVEERSDAILIAFRGTNDLHKWITDADFVPTDDLAGTVHRGFHHALMGIMPKLVDALAKTYKPKPIYWTGHSLGGALAQLAASHWRDYEVTHASGTAGVYTFGQPRVGNRAWAKYYDVWLGAITWRAIHDIDIVPRLPGPIAGYRHAGREYLFDSSGKTEFEPSLLAKVISDAYVFARGHWTSLPELITDHMIGRYVEHLKGIQPG